MNADRDGDLARARRSALSGAAGAGSAGARPTRPRRSSPSDHHRAGRLGQLVASVSTVPVAGSYRRTAAVVRVRTATVPSGSTRHARAGAGTGRCAAGPSTRPKSNSPSPTAVSQLPSRSGSAAPRSRRRRTRAGPRPAPARSAGPASRPGPARPAGPRRWCRPGCPVRRGPPAAGARRPRRPRSGRRHQATSQGEKHRRHRAGDVRAPASAARQVDDRASPRRWPAARRAAGGWRCRRPARRTPRPALGRQPAASPLRLGEAWPSGPPSARPRSPEPIRRSTRHRRPGASSTSEWCPASATSSVPAGVDRHGREPQRGRLRRRRRYGLVAAAQLVAGARSSQLVDQHAAARWSGPRRRLRHHVAVRVDQHQRRPGVHRVLPPRRSSGSLSTGCAPRTAAAAAATARVGLLVRELRRVHADDHQHVGVPGLQRAQLVDDVQAVGAAERPEVEQDDPAAQAGQAQLPAAGVEPAAGAAQLRCPHPSRHPHAARPLSGAPDPAGLGDHLRGRRVGLAVDLRAGEGPQLLLQGPRRHRVGRVPHQPIAPSHRVLLTPPGHPGLHCAHPPRHTPL